MRVLAVTEHSDLPETHLLIGLHLKGLHIEVMCPEDAPHIQKLIFPPPCAGSIPSELGQLTNLQELWLDDNQLAGACNFAFVGPHLHPLRFFAHTGAIPSELGNLAKLTVLDLRKNQLTGACLCRTRPTQTELN